MRAPSISMSVVECPSQVTRRPEAAGVASRAAVSVTSGSGQGGTRISLPNSHCSSAPQYEPEAIRLVGSGFWNLPSTKCDEARIRSSRSPAGTPPNVRK